jgi:antitoxin HigA-1
MDGSLASNAAPDSRGEFGHHPEIALRIGKFCGNGPGLWLRMQGAYDVWTVEKRLRKHLERIPAWG